MGSDGMRGGKDIVAAGGSVIAQDEASSVVWGMPGAAANAGICAAILPLNQIGAEGQPPVRGRPLVTPVGLRLSAQVPERALRPRSLARQAVSGREPAAAAGPQGEPGRHSRSRAEDQERRRPACDRRGRSDDHQRDLLLPRQDPVRSSARQPSCRACSRRAPRASRCASGRRRRRPGRSPIRSRCA